MGKNYNYFCQLQFVRSSIHPASNQTQRWKNRPVINYSLHKDIKHFNVNSINIFSLRYCLLLSWNISSCYWYVPISHIQDMLSLVILSITNPTRRVSMVTVAWHAQGDTAQPLDSGKSGETCPLSKDCSLYFSLSELWGQLLLTQDTHTHT